MTNEKIIYEAAINAGIFTKESAAAILSTGRRLPLHTYQEWRRLGYQVKPGEHAALSVGLWRWKEGKKTGNVVEVPGMYNADGSAAKVEEQESSHHYKTVATCSPSPKWKRPPPPRSRPRRRSRPITGCLQSSARPGPHPNQHNAHPAGHVAGRKRGQHEETCRLTGHLQRAAPIKATRPQFATHLKPQGGSNVLPH